MGNIYTFASASIFLCKTVPNAKDFQKLGTMKYTLSQRQGKFLSHDFKIGLIGNERKSILKVIQFLLLPFLNKILSLPILILSTHTQSNTESSQSICVFHEGQ